MLIGYRQWDQIRSKFHSDRAVSKSNWMPLVYVFIYKLYWGSTNLLNRNHYNPLLEQLSTNQTRTSSQPGFDAAKKRWGVNHSLKMVIFHSYVSLPEGKLYRVNSRDYHGF